MGVVCGFMDIITVVNGAGVEKKIGAGNLALYENAGFKVKGDTDPETQTDDDGGETDPETSAPSEETARANHPSSKRKTR